MKTRFCCLSWRLAPLKYSVKEEKQENNESQIASLFRKRLSQCRAEEKHDIKEKPKIKIPPKTPWYHPFPCKTTKERIVVVTDNKIEIKNDKIGRAKEKEHHAQ